MQIFTNIEKHPSLSRRYIGYARGSVYAIVPDGYMWHAILKVRHCDSLPVSILAKTLSEMSYKLESVGY